MANDYYEHTPGVPADLTRATAVQMRQEFDKLEAFAEKVPELAKLATGSVGFVNDTGGVNAFVLTGVPNVTALSSGMEFRFRAAFSNNGACTMNVNGLGAKPVVRPDGSSLQTGDIFAGQIVSLIYDDTSGGRFQYASSVASATAAAAQYAQAAAQQAGVATSAATTAGISAGSATASAAAALVSETNAAASASQAAASAGSTTPGFMYPVRITGNTAAVVDRSYEMAAANITLTLPTPNQAIAGRAIEFVNTTTFIDPANAPIVQFGTAQLNRGASPGAMRLVTGETRRIRVTAEAPWGWIKA